MTIVRLNVRGYCGRKLGFMLWIKADDDGHMQYDWCCRWKLANLQLNDKGDERVDEGDEPLCIASLGETLSMYWALGWRCFMVSMSGIEMLMGLIPFAVQWVENFIVRL